MLDVKKYLDGKEFNTTVRIGGTSKCFESPVLNCIFRPNELKTINLFKFTRSYEVINITSKNKDATMKFTVEHPGFKHRGVQWRHKHVLPRASNFQFPDAALLRGEDVLQANTKLVLSSGQSHGVDDAIKNEIVDTMEDLPSQCWFYLNR
jgi:hypothetical protein